MHTPIPAKRGHAVLLIGALICCLLLSGCVQGSNSSASGTPTPTLPIPAGWHDVTPPTAQRAAAYAVSPDVPGLIVGCVGDFGTDRPHATVSPRAADGPSGPAKLWRSRDGGAHWQTLGLKGLTSGCSVTMPRGGNGTIFTLATQTTGQPPALVVSHDAGDTWHAVNTDSTQP